VAGEGVARAVLVGALVALLGACAAGGADPEPSPTPTGSPTDEESSLPTEEAAVPSEPEPDPTETSADLPPFTPPTPPELPVEPGIPPPPAPGEPGAVASGLEGLAQQAVEDLVARTGLDPAAVTVLYAQARTWPNAGLGCPEPGMQYTQVPVDGALIRLRAGGTEYEYHSGGDRPVPFLCEQPARGVTATPDPRLSPRPRR
jgi:hypothetical protein